MIQRLSSRRATLAAAESLTGGLLLAHLTSVPGSSSVVRGGVVAYSSEAKVTLLGVDPQLIARVGPVHPDVAAQMAVGCRRILGTTLAVSTTGEAGPDPATSAPVGTFFVAVADSEGVRVLRGDAPGSREQVREAAVDQALALLVSEA